MSTKYIKWLNCDSSMSESEWEKEERIIDESSGFAAQFITGHDFAAEDGYDEKQYKRGKKLVEEGFDTLYIAKNGQWSMYKVSEVQRADIQGNVSITTITTNVSGSEILGYHTCTAQFVQGMLNASLKQIIDYRFCEVF